MLVINLKKKAKTNGFTLVEVMIVVAIIAILFAIAMPSYNAHTTKTPRAEGKAFVMEASQLQERHFTLYGRYATQVTYDPDPTPTPDPAPTAAQLAAQASTIYLTSTSSNGYYVLSITNSSTTTYTFRATPQGAQATNDADCDILTLTHTGIKGVSGSADVNDCW